MTETTYYRFDLKYNKCNFRNSMSQNLQQTKNNENKIKLYWINFITSLLFLCKQSQNPRLKVLLIISSLIQRTIAYHALNVSFNRASVIMNFKILPQNFKISPTKFMKSLRTCISNYTPSAK